MKNFQKLQKKAEKTAIKDNEKIEKRRASLYPQSGDTVSSGDRRQSIAAFSSLTGGGGTMKYSDMTGTVASRKLMGTVFSKIKTKEKERSQVSEIFYCS